MTEIQKVLCDIEIPSVAKVKQKFPDLAMDNVTGVLKEKLELKKLDIKPGQRIAITCGSRGIDQYVPMLKVIVQYVKDCGANPILIPAMGSHGGATAQGQTEVLHHFGITEEIAGAPILSSMEVVEIGITEKGLPVYIDKNAYECDGIILFNRVKPHTTFRGKVESGLIKMTAIGLANHKGAEETHLLGFGNMGENILAVGKITFANLNIVGAVGTIEDSYAHVAELEVLKADEIFEEEPKMLKKAFELMPRLYVDNADVAIFHRQGKDIAGTGFDCNITGRFTTPYLRAEAPYFPILKVTGVLGLTEKTEGNANGMGQADLAPRSYFDQIDFESGYLNSFTSTALFSSKTPIIVDTEKMVFQAAVKCCERADRENCMLLVAEDTKHISEIYMSKAAFLNIPERFKDKVELIGEFKPLEFDENGRLTLFD